MIMHYVGNVFFSLFNHYLYRLKFCWLHNRIFKIKGAHYAICHLQQQYPHVWSSVPTPQSSPKERSWPPFYQKKKKKWKVMTPQTQWIKRIPRSFYSLCTYEHCLLCIVFLAIWLQVEIFSRSWNTIVQPSSNFNGIYKSYVHLYIVV